MAYRFLPPHVPPPPASPRPRAPVGHTRDRSGSGRPSSSSSSQANPGLGYYPTPRETGPGLGLTTQARNTSTTSFGSGAGGGGSGSVVGRPDSRTGQSRPNSRAQQTGQRQQQQQQHVDGRAYGHGHRPSRLSIEQSAEEPGTAVAAPAGPAAEKVHFAVVIRLPFPRSSFVDPPAVEWDEAKDRQLWSIISGAGIERGEELDWEQISAKLGGVSEAFLVQQAAWLYERRLAMVREQMRRVGKAQRSTSVSTPTSAVGPDRGRNRDLDSVAERDRERDRDTGSVGPRATSALSTRSKDDMSRSTRLSSRPDVVPGRMGPPSSTHQPGIANPSFNPTFTARPPGSSVPHPTTTATATATTATTTTATTGQGPTNPAHHRPRNGFNFPSLSSQSEEEDSDDDDDGADGRSGRADSRAGIAMAAVDERDDPLTRSLIFRRQPRPGGARPKDGGGSGRQQQQQQLPGGVRGAPAGRSGLSGWRAGGESVSDSDSGLEPFRTRPRRDTIRGSDVRYVTNPSHLHNHGDDGEGEGQSRPRSGLPFATSRSAGTVRGQASNQNQNVRLSTTIPGGGGDRSGYAFGSGRTGRHPFPAPAGSGVLTAVSAPLDDDYHDDDDDDVDDDVDDEYAYPDGNGNGNGNDTDPVEVGMPPDGEGDGGTDSSSFSDFGGSNTSMTSSALAEELVRAQADASTPSFFRSRFG